MFVLVLVPKTTPERVPLGDACGSPIAASLAGAPKLTHGRGKYVSRRTRPAIHPGKGGLPGPDPTLAVVDVFGLMLEHATYMNHSTVITTLLAGAVLCGVITEWFARRFN